MRGRHADVHERDVWVGVADACEKRLAVGDPRDDLNAVFGQEQRDTFADERGVVGDHDPHGSSATTIVPPAGSLRIAMVPSSASIRSRNPASPPLGESVAPPTPSSLTVTRSLSWLCSTRTVARVAAACLTVFVKASVAKK